MDREWRTRAACINIGPEHFFLDGVPSRRLSTHIERARRICMSCPVRLDCRQAAIDMQEDGGIWGGVVFDRGRPGAMHPEAVWYRAFRTYVCHDCGGQIRVNDNYKADSKGHFYCSNCQ